MSATTKILSGGVFTVVLMFLLVACGAGDPSNPPESSGGFAVTNVNVHGKDLTCVTWKNGYAGGIQCNWDEYNAR